MKNIKKSFLAVFILSICVSYFSIDIKSDTNVKLENIRLLSVANAEGGVQNCTYDHATGMAGSQLVGQVFIAYDEPCCSRWDDFEPLGDEFPRCPGK